MGRKINEKRGVLLYSLEKYTWLLKRLADARGRYSDFIKPEHGAVILRSDIDYDPAFAAQMARVNAENGAIGTFFVLVSSPFYSIFEPKTYKALREIVDAGQNVGLHYHHRDQEFDAERLKKELEALRFVVPEAQSVVAWHNPAEDLDALNASLEEMGLVSAYDSRFFGKGKYTSDSNCTRSAEVMSATVKEANSDTVQVLCHPLIWVLGGADMDDVLDAYVKYKSELLDMDLTEQNSRWAERKA